MSSSLFNLNFVLNPIFFNPEEKDHIESLNKLNKPNQNQLSSGYNSPIYSDTSQASTSGKYISYSYFQSSSEPSVRCTSGIG